MSVKRLFLIAFLLISGVVFAQSPFDGTWKANPDKSKLPPENISLQNGMFKCASCAPAYEVKADGQDHEIKGSPMVDKVNVRQIDDKTIVLNEKKGDKVLSTVKYSAQADGTLRRDWTYTPESGKTVTGSGVLKRVGEPASGAHAVSGTWEIQKVENISPEAMQMTLKSMADGLEMMTPLGYHYNAKFDGKDYPIEGVAGNMKVSLKKVDANTIEETDKSSEGKVLAVNTMSVSSDGKTLTMNVDDKLSGSTMKWILDKQDTTETPQPKPE